MTPFGTLPDDVLIGVDESGTGACAGPYTVCALAVYARESLELRRAGGKDSKSVTDIRRRASLGPISDVALNAYTHFVEVKDLNINMRGSWRHAIVVCVDRVVELLEDRGIARARIKAIIDGNADEPLRHRLSSRVGEVDFLVKADVKVPAVGAASVFAKSLRNDHMLELHREYPQYGWNTNYGYLSAEHTAAINKNGRSPHHRDWKIPGTRTEE